MTRRCGTRRGPTKCPPPTARKPKRRLAAVGRAPTSSPRCHRLRDPFRPHRDHGRHRCAARHCDSHTSLRSVRSERPGGEENVRLRACGPRGLSPLSYAARSAPLDGPPDLTCVAVGSEREGADEMHLNDILLIMVTFIGPVAAVQAQKWIERSREKGDRKLRVFQTLTMTRAARAASIEHVQALNLIDLYFDGKGKDDKAVREAWASLFRSPPSANRWCAGGAAKSS